MLCSFSANTSKENFCKTCFRPAQPRFWVKEESLTNFFIATENDSASGLHKKPVDPWSTVSNGPPLLTAITGRLMYIASIGTSPKCSLLGVYNKQLQCSNSATFWVSLNDRMNVTLSCNLYLSVKVRSSR